MKTLTLLLSSSVMLFAQDRPRPLPDAVPVLARQSYGAADSQLTLLRDHIANGRTGAGAPERLTDRIRIAGDSWRLDVFGDGSAAEFIDQAAARRAHESGVEPARAMSATALESNGRAYIQRSLAGIIVLQPGERLVMAGTSLRTEGGVAPDGRNAHSAVTANRVVFSREINGIPVVGAGSKVTITFLGDGSLESVRYDWPKYSTTGQTQHPATPQEVLRRAQRVAGIRSRRELATPIQYPPSLEAITQPIQLGPGVQLQDLKCGYYDPGFMNRAAAAPVQAGCYYHVVETRGQGEYVTTAAYSGAVPAATSPQPDARWPEAVLIHGGKVNAGPKPKSAKSGKKVQEVPPRPRQ